MHKHPARVQAFDVSAGTAHVFFPEAAQDRCTAALLLEVDPIELVRSRKGPVRRGIRAWPVRQRPAVRGLQRRRPTCRLCHSGTMRSALGLPPWSSRSQL